jgi:hypothetical protein
MKPMANNWLSKIDISKEWKLAAEDPDNVKQLCESIVTKLNNIYPTKDSELEFIIENFSNFNPDLNDTDDFDVYMEQLYNWADIDKRLWIDIWGKPDVSRT